MADALGELYPAVDPPLNLVLVEPLIPQNAGNIGRLCVGTATVLHFVRPLGFDLSEKAVRRAGLDYWKQLDHRVHGSWQEFVTSLPTGARLVGTSRKACRLYTDHRYRSGDYLLFGKETTGLSAEVLTFLGDEMVAIPRLGPVRSHNLGNTASIVLYEALRQITGGFASRGGEPG
jgi:tRNA (cytidine/uridine-2'-O-)-methyltransferase